MSTPLGQIPIELEFIQTSIILYKTSKLKGCIDMPLYMVSWSLDKDKNTSQSNTNCFVDNIYMG